ncbi:hypothetical protein GCM10011369_28000 [Neiella marina]|uniref:Sulfotransferase domain-containing protein n=2 Tax=Neiella marina TaxID=508461 RepID=A0A8J2U7X7_9GAMM|nr:hypothetical protein GCM10011369_28000 [Neiella marina]
MQFSHVTNELAVGDASVRYLYYPRAAKHIATDVPNAKLIAVLREPVSRLYSHYCMNKQFNLEPLELRDAIDAEQQRIDKQWGWDWHYTNIGKYAQQLKVYLKLFPAEQIKIVLYDDFVAQPASVMRDIYQFLDVDDTFVADTSKRGKVPYWPANHTLDRWLTGRSAVRLFLNRRSLRWAAHPVINLLNEWNHRPVPKLTNDDKNQLSRFFKESNQELEELLGRALPWLQHKS